MSTLLFFILRVFTFIPALVLTGRQGQILYQKRGQRDSLWKYRILLFLITLTFAVDAGIVATADFLKYFFGVNHGTFLPSITPLLFLARFIALFAIWFFYKLVYGVKNG